MSYIEFFSNYPNVTAYFTKRDSGKSENVYASLNLGLMTADKEENVLSNRMIVKKHFNLENYIEVIPRQVHKADIAVIKTMDIVAPNKNYFVGDFDGIITKDKNILLTTCHADCLAVYLYDYKNNCIGLSHAGWRGTVLNIAKLTAEKMVADLGADTSTMIAAISPGISKCCFEVGEEVYLEFKQNFKYIDNFAVKKSDSKYLLNLKGINKRQLNDIGIHDVEISDYCTSCNTNLFFSYRKENSNTGRMCAGIAIK